MSPTSLSRPLQAVLLATAVLTAIALLKPEAVDVSEAHPSDARMAPGRTSDAPPAGMPWLRIPGVPWQPADTGLQKEAEAVAPTPVPPPVVPIVDTPRPVAPDPSLIYLGRLTQDGRSYVFLGRGADPQVVEIGGLVDPQWKVEEATATEIRLRYLPLNEVHAISVPAAQ